MDTLLDDVATLPPERVATVRYHEFLASPQREIERLCRHGDLGWDQQLDALPLSRHTLTPPDPDKWRKHEAAIERVMPSIARTVERAERFFAA
jgi:hypothetical protein